MPFPFTCPHCGHHSIVADEYAGQSGPCGACGRMITALPPGTMPRGISDDPGMRLLLPVGRSIWAIAAGYAGLISVLGFPAPLALIFGILAIRDIKRHPEKHGMGRAIFGLVMGGLFTVLLVIGLIGFLAASTGGH